MKTWFTKKAVVLAAMVATMGAATSAQACVWNGYYCVPMCQWQWVPEHFDPYYGVWVRGINVWVCN